MKKLFIYYSLSGNGDKVASYLKDNGYDIRKVNTEEPLPKKYFLSILAGGFKAFIGYKDNLKNFNGDIDGYKKIVIGSPVWNNRLSCPINSVLDRINVSDKDISFILYSGSGKATSAQKFINDRYGEVKIVNLIEPKKNSDELKKLKEF